MLIDTMSEPFDVSKFRDKYREEVMAMIEARAAGKEVPQAKAKPATPGKVVNLMDVLQRSLEQSKGRSTGRGAEAAEEKPRRTARRKRPAA